MLSAMSPNLLDAYDFPNVYLLSLRRFLVMMTMTFIFVFNLLSQVYIVTTAAIYWFFFKPKRIFSVLLL